MADGACFSAFKAGKTTSLTLYLSCTLYDTGNVVARTPEVDGFPLVNKNNLKNLFTYHTTSLSPGKLVILLRKDFGSQQTLILFRKVS